MQSVARYAVAIVLVMAMTKLNSAKGASGDGQITNSVELRESAVGNLASRDAAVRDPAVSALLRDGPIRLEEIQAARDTLAEITTMYARLVTPQRDWRIGHSRPDDQVDDAIAFFVKHDGIAWLVEGLHSDFETQRKVAKALYELPYESKAAHRRLLVANAVETLGNWKTNTGSEDNTVAELTRANITRLAAELIDEPLPPRTNEHADLDKNWDQESKRVVQRAGAWLHGRKS